MRENRKLDVPMDVTDATVDLTVDLTEDAKVDVTVDLTVAETHHFLAAERLKNKAHGVSRG